MEIIVVDYGVGNVASVINMLREVGAKGVLSEDKEQIEQAKKLILPGVGAFDAAMAALSKNGLDQAVINAVNKGVVLLGICLGAQLLFKGSEEGELSGLGLIDGTIRKFSLEEQKLAVPHMGWNIVSPREGSELFEAEWPEYRFYFAHSYYMHCNDQNVELGHADYGHRFTCAVNSGNVFGVQFHPEKSHKFGLKLFENFSQIQC